MFLKAFTALLAAAAAVQAIPAIGSNGKTTWVRLIRSSYKLRQLTSVCAGQKTPRKGEMTWGCVDSSG